MNYLPHNEDDARLAETAELESQTYLRVAETVLAEARRPLKAREIVERGIDKGLFGDHSLSRTPEKSMQARLSIDILKYKRNSRFMRTGRGLFQLRPGDNGTASLAVCDPAGRGEPQEYVAERRNLRTPAEQVLCIPEAKYSSVLTFQGVDTDYDAIQHSLFKESAPLYVARSEAESRNDAKQVITYVIVQCGYRILCFRRSYLSRAAEFLRGSRCIAFGGHVTEADADILSAADRGAANCALRELSEELHLAPRNVRANGSTSDVERGSRTSPLPRQPDRKTISLFRRSRLETLGILNDDSSEVGRRHVAIVYRVWLEDWEVARCLQRGDSSIKGLSWLDISAEKVDISEFEYWSQLCLRKFYPSNVVLKSGFRTLKATAAPRAGAIVVAGRIGSGKTATAEYLSQKLQLPLVNSGQILQQLMQIPPMEEIGRPAFQLRAQEFIESESGPAKLATAIAAEVTARNGERCNVNHDNAATEVVKFHGDFNSPDEMVLSESQYMDRMRLESPMDLKLLADMLGRAVLFIGYSFRDANVNYIFHIVNRLLDRLPDSYSGRRAYIILREPSEFERRLFHTRNIEVVSVGGSEPAHAIADVLRFMTS